MEIAVLGLGNAGKSSFVHVINVSGKQATQGEGGRRSPTNHTSTINTRDMRGVAMFSSADTVGVCVRCCLLMCVQTGTFKENMMATVGFNMHRVQKGKVVIKVWDMGGQAKYRSMWERYSRGVEVIVFVVDSNDPKLFPLAQKEMQSLLAQPTLAGVPLLVLLNKNDLPTAVEPSEIVKELQLETLVNRDVSYYSISCKNIINIDKTLNHIIQMAKKKS